MKKAIIFLFLTFALCANSLFCGNHDFNAKSNTETLLGYVQKDKLTSKKFKEDLKHYEKESGIQPNMQDTAGNTILHYLVQKSDDHSLNIIKKDCLKFFVEKYAHKLDVNIINNNKITALTLALFIKNHDALDIILEKCIDRMSVQAALDFLQRQNNGHTVLKDKQDKSLQYPQHKYVYLGDYLENQTQHKNKMVSIANEWKKFILTGFCYGLMYSIITIDNRKIWENKKLLTFGVMVPMGLASVVLGVLSPVWTGYKRGKTIDDFSGNWSSKSNENIHLAVSFGSCIAGMVARVVLVEKFQKKSALVDGLIQKNPKTAVFLAIVSSLASTAILHKIRSTPEGEQ